MGRARGARARSLIRGLDGLRAVAVLLVIAVHTAGSVGLPWGVLGPLDLVVYSGQLGVDLFFALSGFLITTLILREEARNVAAGGGQRFGIGAFYARRALRILPPFYLVIGLLILFSGASWLHTVRRAAEVQAEAPLALVSILTFWWNYYGSYVHPVEVGQGLAIVWSLCVEEHFYLLWPATLVWLKTPRRRAAIAATVCFGVLALRLVAVLAGEPVVQTSGATHYRLDSITWGVLAAIAREAGWLPPARRRRGLLLVLLLVVGLMLARGDLLVPPNGTMLGYVVGRAAAALVFALTVVEVAETPRGWLTRALEWAPVAWMGRVSYGMYLLHSPSIDLARLVTMRGPVTPSAGHFLLTLALATAVTTALASAMFFVWERPFQRLRARFRPGGGSAPARA
jgi:peptidoglycan/LPS O-acetylase OafA/YrhL